MPLLVHRERRPEPDDLAHLVSQRDLDRLALPHDAHVGPPQFTKKVEGRLGFLPQGQLEGIGPASLLKGFLHVSRHAVEPVRRALAVDPLVGPLVVVVPDPVIQPLPRVGERGEHRVLKEFGPDRLPEPLDLAQRHGVVGGRPDMLDALPLEHLLEGGMAPPRRKLAAVVG
jgi:hypothetical protein